MQSLLKQWLPICVVFGQYRLTFYELEICAPADLFWSVYPLWFVFYMNSFIIFHIQLLWNLIKEVLSFIFFSLVILLCCPPKSIINNFQPKLTQVQWAYSAYTDTHTNIISMLLIRSQITWVTHHVSILHTVIENWKQRHVIKNTIPQ